MEDRLKKFAGVVDAGNFTKAAAAMRISQPALTAAVKKLERELKAELLVRGNHSCVLTPAGRIAYAAAKELHTLGSNLRLRLGALAGERTRLNLGAIDAMAALLFAEGNYLQELEQHTRLSLSINNSRQLLDLVSTDALDLAIVAAPEAPKGGLTLQRLGREPLVFVGRHDTAAAAHARMKQGNIHNFLAYNQNSQSFALIAAHFIRHHIYLEPVFYSTSPEIMLQQVLAGRGVAVLPYLLVRQALKDRQLVTIAIGKTPIITRNIVAAHRTGRLLPAQATELIGYTTAKLDALYAQAAARHHTAQDSAQDAN